MAAEVLLALERHRTTLAAEVDRVRVPLADPRDRALLVELTFGTVRWRQQLDTLIAAASRRSVRTIDPRALAVLRLGVYQLRHLARIPPHAVVHESVDVVRALGAVRAAGFVNAVLRAVVRRGASLALPRRPGPEASEAAEVRYLSITLSHPAWLVTRWLRRYGFEATERWCQFNNASPTVTVRSNGRLSTADLLARISDAGGTAEPAPYAAGAIRLAPGVLGSLPADLGDALVVQDEGAQIVAAAAHATAGERVLDLCAAPGGKTLVLADALQTGDRRDRSLLVAADSRPARVALLAARLRAAGVGAPVVRLDASQPLPFGPVFDCVLLDAPCSGLGTLRRDPDLKWSRDEADLAGLADTARTMADRAAAAVRLGGRLVYATCSSEPEENEAVVEAFTGTHPDWRPARIHLDGPAAALVDEAGHLVTRPSDHGLDAFFAASLVRQSGA